MTACDGRGLFIVLEGIDGSGKSTQIELLKQTLVETGRPCEITREPTGGPVGRLLRDILQRRIKAEPETAALLFAADRYEHTAEIIELLRRNMTVLSDRYYYSSIAYQGMELGHERVITLNGGSMAKLKPDLVVFIDVSPEECAKRMAERPDKEIFDALDTQKRVRQSFFKTFDLLKDAENIAVIPASGDQEQVAKAIWDRVTELL